MPVSFGRPEPYAAQTARKTTVGISIFADSCLAAAVAAMTLTHDEMSMSAIRLLYSGKRSTAGFDMVLTTSAQTKHMAKVW